MSLSAPLLRRSCALFALIMGYRPSTASLVAAEPSAVTEVATETAAPTQLRERINFNARPGIGEISAIGAIVSP